MKPAEEVSNQHQSQFLQEQSKKTAGNDVITGTAPRVQVSSTSGVLPDTSIEELSIRRVHADIYTNSAAALEKIPSSIVTSLQRLSLLPSNPTPIISTSTMRVKNLSTEEITARLVIDENREAQQVASSKSKSAPTIINQYTAGIMYISHHQPPADKLPEMWKVPPKNTKFTGRSKLIQDINDYSRGQQEKAEPLIFTAFYGLGGVGKTHVALAYVWQNYKNYKGVCWFNVETKDVLIIDYINLGNHLHIFSEEDNNLSPIERAIKIKVWLENNAPYGWLLVYDNPVNYSEVVELLPVKGGHILVTSRYKDWPGLCLEVNVFSLEEAREYAEKIIGIEKIKIHEESLKVLIDDSHLGKLPLGLAQAFAYIDKNKINIDSYLGLYNKIRMTLLAERLLPIGDKHEAVTITWWATIQKIREESQFAFDLLYYCAHLYPVDIPYEILEQIFVTEDTSIPELVKNSVLNAKRIIEEYSMIKVDNDGLTLSMHNLVQDIILLSLYEQNHRLMLIKFGIQKGFHIKKVIMIITKYYNYDFTELASIYQSEKILLHALSAARHAYKNGYEIKAADQIFKKIIHYYNFWHQGFDGKLYAEEFLQAQKKNYGEISQEYAEALSDLAEIEYYHGDYSVSEELYNKSLNIYQQVKPSNKYTTIKEADTTGGLGDIYYKKGRYNEALQQYNKVFVMLSSYEGNPSEKIFSYALNCHQIANVYYKMGYSCESIGEHDNANKYYKAAKEYYQLALMKKKEHFKKDDHPNIARTIRTLGDVLIKLGEPREAIAQINSAITIYKVSLKKEEHPDVEKALCSLAEVEYALSNNLASCEKLFEKANKIREVIYRSVKGIHPDIAINHLRCGDIYLRAGHYNQAKEQYEKALNIIRSKFGENHPDILLINAKLAKLISLEASGNCIVEHEQNIISASVIKRETSLRPN